MRTLKTVKKANAARLAYHLEHLGSAWCRETGIHPTSAELIEQTRDDGTTAYRYTIANFHPDNLHPQIREALLAARDVCDGVDGSLERLRACLATM
jgi:hypothetical protein